MHFQEGNRLPTDSDMGFFALLFCVCLEIGASDCWLRSLYFFRRPWLGFLNLSFHQQSITALRENCSSKSLFPLRTSRSFSILSPSEVLFLFSMRQFTLQLYHNFHSCPNSYLIVKPCQCLIHTIVQVIHFLCVSCFTFLHLAGSSTDDSEELLFMSAKLDSTTVRS